MKKAGQYFKEACNKHEADQKRLKKDLYDEPYFVEAIRQAQMDAIDAAAAVIKKKYPAGLTNTAKYVSDQVLKLKEEL